MSQVAELNIEFTGCFDTGLGQDLFDEVFDNSAYKDEVVYRGDFDFSNDLDKEYVLNDDYTMKEFILFVADTIYPSIDNEYELFKLFRTDYFDNESWRDLKFDFLIEILEKQLMVTGCEEVIEEIGGDWIVSNFEYIDCVGYNQGEFAKVVLFDKVKAEFADGFDFKSMFENLIFDSPISGELIVGDTELCVCDFVDDNNYWDKDLLMKKVIELFPKSVCDSINDIVPLELDYS